LREIRRWPLWEPPTEAGFSGAARAYTIGDDVDLELGHLGHVEQQIVVEIILNHPVVCDT
jgi:hypothetical protein